MRLRQRKAFKALAAFLVLAVAQVYTQFSLAEPNSANTVLSVQQQLIARLTQHRGRHGIAVNGNNVGSGASIVTGALIETSADQSATINLGPFGSVEIGPTTGLRLDYDDQGNAKVTLTQGCVIVRSKKKAVSEVVTNLGSAGKTDGESGSYLDVCFLNGKAIVNQGAAMVAGAGAGAGAGTGGGISSATILLIGLGAAGVGVAVLAGGGGGGGGPSGGTNPSPSSP